MIDGNEKKPCEWYEGYHTGNLARKTMILGKMSEELSDTKRMLDKAEKRFGASWTRDEEGFIEDANQNLRYAYTEGYRDALKDVRDLILKGDRQ